MLYSQQCGQGPDLVLLHGWGLNSAIWQSFLPGLSQDFRVTVIDLPGMGLSPLSVNEYSLAEVSEALLAAAPAQASWLGWSMGGLLAQAVAVRAPTRVNRLITLCSTPCFVGNDKWPGLPSSVLEEFAQQLHADRQAVVEHFLQVQLLRAGDKRLIRQIKQAVLQHGQAHAFALTGGLSLLQQVDLRDVLHEVRCPQLSILGRLDALVPVQVADEMRARGIACEVLANAAHVPFLTHATDLLALLREFCYDRSCA